MNEFQIWLADTLAERIWTPDVPRLETQDYWYVFTYANRRGKKSDYFLSDTDADYVSVGWTKNNLYSILNVQTNTKTVPLAAINGTDKILGEVWSVPTPMMYELDADECNLLYTKRFLAPIHIRGAKTVDAWIYTADPAFLLKGGIKVSKLTSYSYYAGERFLEVA